MDGGRGFGREYVYPRKGMAKDVEAGDVVIVRGQRLTITTSDRLGGGMFVLQGKSSCPGVDTSTFFLHPSERVKVLGRA